MPVYSVSSIFRPDQVFFRWYGYQYRYVLRCFTHFFVQNETSRDLLVKLGITNVTITGDTRFDRVLQIKEQSKQLPVIDAFKKDYKVFVAGSSWSPDEDIFIKYFNEHKEWRLIIAPHVIGEDHLKEILAKLNRKTVRYTEATVDNVNDAECLIIDCFGLLSSIYHFGEVAYVGGGFGVGIHNVLEAAVWNMPVLFGPNNSRFQEAQGLLNSKGGFEITDYDSFEHIMNSLVSNAEFLEESGNKAGDFVKKMTGATDIVLSQISL